MNKSHYQVGEILSLFKDELKHLYEEKEIMNLICLLFEEWEGWSKARFLMERNSVLQVREASGYLNALSELRTGKPVQYLTGVCSFDGLRIKVTPDVLIPRPETEELVVLASKKMEKKEIGDFSILDIGTGSGCIALSLKKRFPWISVTAIDVSASALGIARENSTLNQCEVKFLQVDITEKKEYDKLPCYHFIISNPPYVTESDKQFMKKNVLDFEPPLALFVQDENPLLFYHAITDFALTHLIRPGRLFLEINENQASGIQSLLKDKKFKNIQLLPDLHQKTRFASAELDE